MANTVANTTMADYPFLIIKTQVTSDNGTLTETALDHGGPTDVSPLFSTPPITTTSPTDANIPHVSINYDTADGTFDIVQISEGAGSVAGWVWHFYTVWPCDTNLDGSSLDNF